MSSCRFLGFFNQLLNIPFTSHNQLSCLYRAVESCPLLYTVMEEGPVRSPSTPLPRPERYRYPQREWSGISCKIVINTGSVSPWMDQCTCRVLRVQSLRLRLLRKFLNLRSIQNENICAPGCSYSSLYRRIGTVV